MKGCLSFSTNTWLFIVKVVFLHFRCVQITTTTNGTVCLSLCRKVSIIVGRWHTNIKKTQLFPIVRSLWNLVPDSIHNYNNKASWMPQSYRNYRGKFIFGCAGANKKNPTTLLVGKSLKSGRFRDFGEGVVKEVVSNVWNIFTYRPNYTADHKRYSNFLAKHAPI